MKSTFISAIRSATDLLFPPRCVHCGTDGSLFCDACVSAVTRLKPGEACRTCALPSPGGTCEACFHEPPSLNRAIAVFTYEPSVRDAVTALKYRDIRALAPRLGALMADALPVTVRQSSDLLIPVPVSGPRMRSRGYNQAELLARPVAGQTGIRMEPGLLKRTGEGRPQARSASIEERSENVRNAFQATVDLTGKSVLLIDDVMTTGSTLNACAAALKDAGAARVGALVLAREL